VVSCLCCILSGRKAVPRPRKKLSFPVMDLDHHHPATWLSSTSDSDSVRKYHPSTVILKMAATAVRGQICDGQMSRNICNILVYMSAKFGAFITKCTHNSLNIWDVYFQGGISNGSCTANGQTGTPLQTHKNTHTTTEYRDISNNRPHLCAAEKYILYNEHMNTN